MTLVSHFLLVFNSSSNIVIYCWKDEKFRKVESKFVLTLFDIQVLLGLLGWRSQPALGGGRLRGGEALALPSDLTITTCAPWDPGALSSAPRGSSNRDDGNTEMAETGFISESRKTIIANINPPDQID